MRETGNLHVDPGTSCLVARELPPIAALFVITFDIKAGYTISWKKTAQGVSLDGVEFKSLPSGLHNLDEDLVYFVQAPYAGVSAFIKVPAAEAERNALMLSVGILVPLSYGRLGRSWRHAENLKNLAAKYAANTTDHRHLDEYYGTHQIHETAETDADSPVESPSSLRYRPAGRYKPPFDRFNHTRARSVSDTTALVPPGQTLSPFHPALSLGEYVDMFGPLIFPLYRAALNRQRILLITGAPVEQACNFVYDISILSNIPLSVADLLSSEPSRLRPLFSVGVHDIPFLEDEAKRHTSSSPPSAIDNLGGEAGSWVACTTDGVLYLKSSLYDVVCTLPPVHNRDAKKKAWPSIESPAGTHIKATQRDLARYRTLRRSMRRYGRRKWQDDSNNNNGDRNNNDDDDEEEEEEYEDEDTDVADGNERYREEQVCEKLSWREIAYTSFIWWASAGEKRSDPSAEDNDIEDDGDGDDDNNDNDNDLAAPLASPDSDTLPLYPRPRPRSRSHHRRRRSSSDPPGSMEMEIVAYFHRLTGRLLSVMADIVEEGDEEEDVFFSLEDVERLGLDRYSEGDVKFVRAVCRRYFGREASVEQGGWNCCAGVKWC